MKYGSRASSYAFSNSLYFGYCVTQGTLLNKTEEFRDNKAQGSTFYKDRCIETLQSNIDLHLVVMDNN